MKTKLLLVIGAGTFALMSGVTVASRLQEPVNYVKSLYVPTDIVGYDGYRKATKSGTLLDGVKFAIVSSNAGHDYVSSDASVGENFFIPASQNDVVDGKLTHSNPFTLKTTGVDNEFEILNSSGQYLGPVNNYPSTYNFKYNDESGDRTTWSITFSSEVATIMNTSPSLANKYITPKSDFSSFIHWNSLDDDTFIYVDSNSAVEAWIKQYMYMDDDVEGQCEDYFGPAKAALLAMDDFVKANFYNNSKYDDVQERYEHWASYHHQEPYKA